jgi:hypothetical protein
MLTAGPSPRHLWRPVLPIVDEVPPSGVPASYEDDDLEAEAGPAGRDPKGSNDASDHRHRRGQPRPRPERKLSANGSLCSFTVFPGASSERYPRRRRRMERTATSRGCAAGVGLPPASTLPKTSPKATGSSWTGRLQRTLLKTSTTALKAPAGKSQSHAGPRSGYEAKSRQGQPRRRLIAPKPTRGRADLGGETTVLNSPVSLRAHTPGGLHRPTRSAKGTYRRSATSCQVATGPG